MYIFTTDHTPCTHLLQLKENHCECTLGADRCHAETPCLSAAKEEPHRLKLVIHVKKENCCCKKRKLDVSCKKLGGMR